MQDPRLIFGTNSIERLFFKVPRHILEAILFLVNPYYIVEQGIFKGMNFCGFIHINLFFNVRGINFCGFGMYVQRKEIFVTT